MVRNILIKLYQHFKQNKTVRLGMSAQNLDIHAAIAQKGSKKVPPGVAKRYFNYKISLI